MTIAVATGLPACAVRSGGVGTDRASVAELEFPSKSEQPARDWVAGGLLSGR
jgi:hypothetical protein